MQTFWKRWCAWLLTGFAPRCQLCGKLMEVAELFSRHPSTGESCTYYICPDDNQPDHEAYREIAKRWAARVKEFQEELEAEDAALPNNFSRAKYGKIKVEVRRK